MNKKYVKVLLFTVLLSFVLACPVPESAGSGTGTPDTTPSVSLSVSHPSGFIFMDSQDVTITCTDETIYYTIDGSEPTISSSQASSSITLTLDSSTTVKAKIFSGTEELDSLSADYEKAPSTATAVVVLDVPSEGEGKSATIYLSDDLVFKYGRTHELTIDSLKSGLNCLVIDDSDWPVGDYYICAKSGGTETFANSDLFGTYRPQGNTLPELVSLSSLDGEMVYVDLKEGPEIMGDWVYCSASLITPEELPYSFDLLSFFISDHVVEWDNNENWFVVANNDLDSFSKYGWESRDEDSFYITYYGYSDVSISDLESMTTSQYHEGVHRLFREHHSFTHDAGYAGGGTIRGSFDFGSMANKDRVTHILFTLEEITGEWPNMVDSTTYIVDSFLNYGGSFEFTGCDPDSEYLITGKPLDSSSYSNPGLGLPLGDESFTGFSFSPEMDLLFASVDRGETLTVSTLLFTGNESDYEGSDGIDFTGTIDISQLYQWEQYTGIIIEFYGEDASSTEISVTYPITLNGTDSLIYYNIENLNPDSSFEWDMDIDLYDDMGNGEVKFDYGDLPYVDNISLSETDTLDITVTDTFSAGYNEADRATLSGELDLSQISSEEIRYIDIELTRNYQTCNYTIDLNDITNGNLDYRFTYLDPSENWSIKVKITPIYGDSYLGIEEQPITLSTGSNTLNLTPTE